MNYIQFGCRAGVRRGRSGKQANFTSNSAIPPSLGAISRSEGKKAKVKVKGALASSTYNSYGRKAFEVDVVLHIITLQFSCAY